MNCRRVVVWIATGILGFQGVTLGLGLLHCLVLSGLHVNRHLQVQPALGFCDPSQQRIDDALGHGITAASVDLSGHGSPCFPSWFGRLVAGQLPLPATRCEHGAPIGPPDSTLAAVARWPRGCSPGRGQER